MADTILSPDGFADIGLAWLDRLAGACLDLLPYGVVGLDDDFLVVIYNKTEERMAGLPAASVIGTHFFLTTAQCMNNFLVAQRFEDEAELDTIVDFVLTFRMRPTIVRLRLLQGAASKRRYILIER